MLDPGTAELWNDNRAWNYEALRYATAPAYFSGAGATDTIRSISSHPGADERPVHERLAVDRQDREGVAVEVVRGDYAPLMARVVAGLTDAQKHAANAHQASMNAKYADSFYRGSMLAHIDGSGVWVKDKGPITEMGGAANVALNIAAQPRIVGTVAISRTSR